MLQRGGERVLAERRAMDGGVAAGRWPLVVSEAWWVEAAPRACALATAGAVCAPARAGGGSGRGDGGGRSLSHGQTATRSFVR